MPTDKKGKRQTYALCTLKSGTNKIKHDSISSAKSAQKKKPHEIV